MVRAPHPAEVALASSLYPGAAWAGGRVEEGGQSHLVLVAEGQAVLRMARTPEVAADMDRGVALVDALAPLLPYRLPQALAPVWRPTAAPDDGGSAPGSGPQGGVGQQDGASRQDVRGQHGGGTPVAAAVVQEFVPGAAHPPHHGDARTLARLVRELAEVDVEPLRPLLAPPFSFRGPWDDAKTAAVLRALPADLVQDAAAVVQAVRSWASATDCWGPGGPDGTAGLVHGDLAGHNMHWVGGRLAGILDWDLAAAWDPALNAAYLGLWHGCGILPEIAEGGEEAARAEVWMGAMALDSYFDALQRTDGPDLGKLLGKVGSRVRGAARAAAGL